MENNDTEALLQDEGNKEIQDIALTTNQEEHLSKDITDTETKAAADDKAESTGDCSTETDADEAEFTKVLTPVINRAEGDGEAVEPLDDVLSEGNTKKEEIDLPDGAPGSLNEESEEKSEITPESSTEATAQDLEEKSDSATEEEEPLPQKAPTAEQTLTEDIETIGPTPFVESKPISEVSPSLEETRRTMIWIAVAVVFAAVVVAVFLQWFRINDLPATTDLRQIDIFHQEMEKLEAKFPSQRKELWKRSRIHLQRHFQTTQPSEPVSIILTAGVRAEGTLHCLAQSIALALSSAVNATALYLDGVSKSSQDSDLVKSDIDTQLQKAFEGGKPIAVIHRFEELPPASTLIFYRYCDHENAAFKKTFLIFTVLLGEEEEIQAKIRLSEVEEMVTDHLQRKFLSHGHPTAFDKMDIDKYGGLWSRISHLILPVATEKRIESTQQC